jgi:hypothetical protein
MPDDPGLEEMLRDVKDTGVARWLRGLLSRGQCVKLTGSDENADAPRRNGTCPKKRPPPGRRIST